MIRYWAQGVITILKRNEMSLRQATLFKAPYNKSLSNVRIHFDRDVQSIPLGTARNQLYMPM